MTGEARRRGRDAFKITAKGVIGTSVLLGAVNMVLFTALMTLAAFVYNVCADLVGGVELTLSEKECTPGPALTGRSAYTTVGDRG